MVVYTALIGRFDVILRPLQSNGVRYVIFSDVVIHAPAPWEVVKVAKMHGRTDRLEARWYKTHPHVLFPDEDWTIWQDANCQMLVDPRLLVQTLYSMQSTYGALRHPRIRSVSKELEACICCRNDSQEIMEAQVARYYSEGFVDKFHFDTGCVIRDGDIVSSRLNQAWWDEIQNGSVRDQLSFPYVLWKTGVRVHQFNERKNYFETLSHGSLNRAHIINRLIFDRGYVSYFEIGVEKGSTFRKIVCSEKMSVDPNPQANPTFCMTSDKFFAITRETLTFDLIFIDGLHHADQVFRDILNAMCRLNPGGTIVVHDLNPHTEAMQKVPRVQAEWTGDSWRAWLQFRSKYAVNAFVLDTDYGVGIIEPWKVASTQEFPDVPTYLDLVRHRQEWLNLRTVKEWWNSEIVR